MRAVLRGHGTPPRGLPPPDAQAFAEAISDWLDGARRQEEAATLMARSQAMLPRLDVLHTSLQYSAGLSAESFVSPPAMQPLSAIQITFPPGVAR